MEAEGVREGLMWLVGTVEVDKTRRGCPGWTGPTGLA